MLREGSPVLSVELAATEQAPVVFRLLQLYLHDFSGFAKPADPYGLIGDDGLFPYRDFASYWTNDPGRQAYLFRLGGAPAGFALVNDWPPSGEAVDHALAEFFILRKYRRSGVGREAAGTLFRTLPGSWELGVASYNTPALTFWRAAPAAASVRGLREFPGDGVRWHGSIFRFAT